MCCSLKAVCIGLQPIQSVHDDRGDNELAEAPAEPAAHHIKPGFADSLTNAPHTAREAVYNVYSETQYEQSTNEARAALGALVAYIAAM